MGGREHPAAPGPEHPRDLAHHPRRVRDERDRAECREREVEARVAERQVGGVGLDERDVYAARPHRRRAWRSIPADRSDATGSAPAPASQREHIAAPQPTSSTCGRGHRRAGGRPVLAQVLRAPDEVGDAEERAVLGVVGVRVAVPPAAVGPDRGGGVRPRAASPRSRGVGSGGSAAATAAAAPSAAAAGPAPQLDPPPHRPPWCPPPVSLLVMPVRRRPRRWRPSWMFRAGGGAACGARSLSVIEAATGPGR